MSQPAISIIIPVYNDAEGLELTVGSLLAHTDPDAEIILVDNNSTDRTPEIAADYAADHDHITLVFEREIQSSYAARNTGIEQATGEILVFLDADQRVTDGWLTALVGCLDTADYVAPNIELDAGENPTLIGQYNKTTGFPIEDFLTYHRYAPTSCLAVRRELIDDVGEFDDRLISGGDLEFGNRVDRAGYEFAYCPASTVIHPTRNSFGALYERNVRIGRGHCQLQSVYPDRYGRVGIPPRPSDIRSQQYDNSQGRLLFTLLTVIMTATRGLGYYRECLAVWAGRLRN
jgi:glycosyltransferase involved in cell wall biosynthesis